MKKFKFSLEGLRKLREFNEQKVKIELGRVLREIEEKKQRVRDLKASLEVSGRGHEAMAKAGTEARSLQFFPMYNLGRQADIERTEQEIRSLRNEQMKLTQELNTKRAETKVIEKMKDEAQTKHQKEQEKKMYQELEEIFLMTRKQRKERGAL